MAKKPSRPIVTCNGTTVASTEIRKMIDEIHKLQDDIDKKQNKVDELKDEVIKFMAKSEAHMIDKALMTKPIKTIEQRDWLISLVEDWEWLTDGESYYHREYE